MLIKVLLASVIGKVLELTEFADWSFWCSGAVYSDELGFTQELFVLANV